MQVAQRVLLALAALFADHAIYARPPPIISGSSSGKEEPAKRDTSQLPRPALGSVPYGADIRSCTVPGKVALTFDDGPWQYTSDLLDVLDASNEAKATFFVVGNNQDHPGHIDDPATGYPDILRRMHAAGHQIGSHTWTHADLETLTTEGRRAEILENENALASVLGFFPTYLRPPYTSCLAQCVSDIGALGYHVANYDVDTKDYQGDYDYARAVYRGNVTASGAGSPQEGASHVVLAHDVWDGTVHGFAQFMIDEARRAGFELVTMGDCLGDPAENWYRDASTGGAWTG